MNRRDIARIVSPGLAAGGVVLGALWLGAGPWLVALSAALAGSIGGLIRLRHHGTSDPLATDAPTGTVPSAAAPSAPAPAVDPLPVGIGRALLEHMPIGFILIDRQHDIQFVNREARSQFGFGPSKTEDLHLSMLRAPGLVETVETVLVEGGTRSVDFAITRGGQAHMRAHVRHVALDGALAGEVGGGAALVMIEDRSEAKRTQTLHRDFVANASHELKTPLASISGIIETLLGHARDDPEATERFLELMAQQTARMKRLVDDLLSLNRVEINERVRPRETLEIGQVLGSAADGLARMAAEHGVSLAREPGDRETVLGDREELTQVFVNLIENAIRYGAEGNAVEIGLRRDPEARADQVGAFVRDHGPGIPREHIPRLTERFYRVSVSRSREKGGTGLGLAIVKHIVNRHRGELSIESEPGAGACFTVWLPVAGRGAQAGESLDHPVMKVAVTSGPDRPEARRPPAA